MRVFVMLALSAFLAGCYFPAIITGPPSGPPREVVYVPTYAIFPFTLDGRYRIQHEYFDFTRGEQSFRGGCSYGGGNKTGRAYSVGDMFEQGNHVFQMTPSIEGIYAANMDRFVLGAPRISHLTGQYNEKTKQWEGGTPYIYFEPLCSDWIGGYEFAISLRKSSAQTIEAGIAHRIANLEGPWAGHTRWLPPEKVKRGANTWTVFRNWNELMYRADAAEDWYLPIGDGSYYYKTSFAYKSWALENERQGYTIARGAFEHILDSFVIEPLLAAPGLPERSPHKAKEKK